MRQHDITIEGIDTPYRCPAGQTLLGCMGADSRKAITVGCRGGGCGVCKVAVVSGRYASRRMSREHISVEQEANGIVLACRVMPQSDMVVRVIGLLRKRYAG